MNRHTDQLYRLAELPAFIEEALSNVSLKDIITSYLSDGPSVLLKLRISNAVNAYAEQWVDDWMARHQPNLWEDREDSMDPELMAIECGVELFSKPDCKAGLPE